MKSIIILIDYFGKWPEWFPIYLESCRRNPTINWLIHTDCPFDNFDISNVKFRYISKEDYIQQARQKLKIRFNMQDSYKLNDLKPAFGFLHEEEINGYDIFGYGDIDLIYGDIRRFYTDSILENNVISTHEWCLSGHLALFQNTKRLRNAFRQVSGWQKVLENPADLRFDEEHFSQLFIDQAGTARLPSLLNKILHPVRSSYRKKMYLTEQYTTPLTPGKWRNGSYSHPKVWFWKDGHVTNELDHGIEFIYFHFMNFKHDRYMNRVFGTAAYWSKLDKLVHVQPADIGKGIRIDRFGFHGIDAPYKPGEE